MSGSSAFAHKAGLHASAIKVDPELYNHMDPVDVGNGQRVLVTEMAGRASVELKGRELGLDLAGHPDAVSSVVGTVKEREAQGWSFEAADASLELLMRSALGDDDGAPLPFPLESYRVLIENRGGDVVSEATVKLVVDGRADHRDVRGQRPGQRAGRRPARGAHAVAAVARGRRAVGLQGPHPRAAGSGETRGTDAVTRVLVESDRRRRAQWTTVGVHGNVVEASWLALVDAVAFAGLRRGAPAGAR